MPRALDVAPEDGIAEEVDPGQQYRVGRNGRIETAASRRTSTSYAISTDQAPKARPPGPRSMKVDRNSAIAAHPKAWDHHETDAPSRRQGALGRRQRHPEGG